NDAHAAIDGGEFLGHLVDDGAAEIEMHGVELGLEADAEIDTAGHDESAARGNEAALLAAGEPAAHRHRTAQMDDHEMIGDRAEIALEGRLALGGGEDRPPAEFVARRPDARPRARDQAVGLRQRTDRSGGSSRHDLLLACARLWATS